jgi:hypothetical protein
VYVCSAWGVWMGGNCVFVFQGVGGGGRGGQCGARGGSGWVGGFGQNDMNRRKVLSTHVCRVCACACACVYVCARTHVRVLLGAYA